MTTDNELQSDDDEELFDEGDASDVSLHPGPNADDPSEVKKYISSDILEMYDVYSYRHAAAILYNTSNEQLKQIEHALRSFSITKKDIGTPGGNESVIPKKFSQLLRPVGWHEARIQGDLHVRMVQYDDKYSKSGKATKTKLPEGEARIITNYIDGHKIDYVQGKVAFDLEWNSKDQTFDRDLYALRAFHECSLISAGVLLTRSKELNPVFHTIPLLDKEGNFAIYSKGKKKGQQKFCIAKYGASTTWMGKLLYRLNAGRHGGCPVLVFGITPKVISDLDK